MKQILALLLLLGLTTVTNAQRFILTYDTICIDRQMLGSPDARCRIKSVCQDANNLFLLVNYSNSQLNSTHSIRQIVVDINREDGKTRIIDVPEQPEWVGEYQNMFVRNDSIILKRNSYYFTDMMEYNLSKQNLENAVTDADRLYHKEEIELMHDYMLVPSSTSWQATTLADDAIWDDHDYHVTIMPCGEWGYYIMFCRKHDSRKFIYQWHSGMGGSVGNILRCFEWKGTYYVVGRKGIFTVRHPEQGQEYTNTPFYEIESSSDNYSILDILLTIPDNSTENIATTFVAHGRIYLIMYNHLQTYLAMLHNGQISKIGDIAFCMKPYGGDGSEMRMNNISASRSMMQSYDNILNARVLITVDGNYITITHIKI